MPRRNLYLLSFLAVVSLACYQKAGGRYTRWFDTIKSVADTVDRHYVEPVESRELFEGALNGMIDRLDDYSAYYAPQSAAESREQLEQKFGGIGIEISLDPETRYPTVTNPIFGTPAYEAGINAGDRIVRVDGESTEGLTLHDCSTRLRGEVGEPVTLSIERPGQEKAIDITIRRALIQVQSVLGDTRGPDGKWNYMLPGKEQIGYIRVSQFGERTVDELRDALKKLSAAKPKALVLDLRDNSGGLLDAAVTICDLFLREGLIVSTRGRAGVVLKSYSASGKAPYAELPLAVLINGHSASAAEIVAACLQDHGRAVVVGQRSYGKGTVQQIFLLEGGRSELRLTTASYWRPSGQNINRRREATEKDEWGVRPDAGMDVPLSVDELKAWFAGRRQRDHLPKAGEPQTVSDDLSFDPVLKKAVEVLRGQLKGPAIAERPAKASG